ncbi:MAG: protocatechuate 3,4-dioxygenase subunit alpha [Mycobacterium sp.]|nr:protocatechuate 3,4-dioxygenase subunit alpha [Mycobacterium sp.]
MTELIGTAGQTVGPFFHDALTFPGASRLVTDTHPGAIQLHGVVYDGAGDGVPDALIEIWQPDSDGTVVQRPGSLRRDGSAFTGWGRAATDASGHYSFTTLTPGSATAQRPPFFAITVFARGLLDRLFTRAYLPEGQLAGDPLLNAVRAERRHTLVCATESTGYRFDIHLQGVDETVFLDYRDGRP